MDRPPSCCDFCGDLRTFQEYPTDSRAVNWYACSECAAFIDAQDWKQLIERSLAAYAQVRPIPDGEERILRERVENLVATFRSFRFVAA